jgi:CBS domain-containing protein
MPWGGDAVAMTTLETHAAQEMMAPSHRSRNTLSMEARELMTPGVISIVEDATLSQVRRALAAHHVHALLVLGRQSGRPLGWVTARGLLAWLEGDPSLACARDAITEPAVTIGPSATGREALAALGQPRVGRLLVQRHAKSMPEGVISELDLVVGPRR